MNTILTLSEKYFICYMPFWLLCHSLFLFLCVCIRVTTIRAIPSGGTQTFDFSPVKGRYVNIYLPGTNKYLTLCEVQVFEGEIKRERKWFVCLCTCVLYVSILMMPWCSDFIGRLSAARWSYTSVHQSLKQKKKKKKSYILSYTNILSYTSTF